MLASSEKKIAKKSLPQEARSAPVSKAETILHPIRLRVLMTLAGRELTTQQLSAQLPDIAKASLYRHVSALCGAGMLRVVQETPIRGTLEKVYAVCEEASHLQPQEMAGIPPEEHVRYFTIYVASLLAQFRDAIAHNPAALSTGEIGYGMIPLHLTEEEFGEMASELNAVISRRLANKPGTGRRRRLLSLIAIPDGNDDVKEVVNDVRRTCEPCDYQSSSQEP